MLGDSDQYNFCLDNRQHHPSRIILSGGLFYIVDIEDIDKVKDWYNGKGDYSYEFGIWSDPTNVTVQIGRDKILAIEIGGQDKLLWNDISKHRVARNGTIGDQCGVLYHG